MNLRQFSVLLAATSALILFLNLVLGHFFYSFTQHRGMMWWSLALFVPLSIIMFFVGQAAANSTNKMLFHNLIIASVFTKMLLSVFIVLIYRKVFQPESKYFTFPFFIVYFVFTIFETYVMVKIGKPTKR